jgi:hypothetical protein
MSKKLPSDVFYEKIMLESQKKGSRRDKSMRNLKSACDKIVAIRGNWSVAQVARMTKGTPALRTIYNNILYSDYIELRRQEYLAKYSFKEQIKQKEETEPYPVAGLDVKTRQEFDYLRSRNIFLEKTLARLDKDLLEATQNNGEDLAESITMGPDDDMNLQTVYSKEKPQIVLKKAVEEIMAFILSNPEITVFHHDNKKELVKEKQFGREVILSDEELKAIEQLINTQLS